MHGMYGFDFGIGHIAMMVFWVVIVGLVLWALFSAKGTPSVQAETPLEIAQKRYAKGEISKQEFDDIRHNL